MCISNTYMLWNIFRTLYAHFIKKTTTGSLLFPPKQILDAHHRVWWLWSNFRCVKEKKGQKASNWCKICTANVDCCSNLQMIQPGLVLSRLISKGRGSELVFVLAKHSLKLLLFLLLMLANAACCCWYCLCCVFCYSVICSCCLLLTGQQSSAFCSSLVLVQNSIYKLN